jgi:hypothetical protein
MRVTTASAVILLTCTLLSAADGSFQPARYLDGGLPNLSPSILAGGEVILELAVARDGSVRDVKTLRATPPYTEALSFAVRSWRFQAAEQLDRGAAVAAARRPVDATVLVVGVFRPPALTGPTLGDVPRDVGSEVDGTPFPVTIVQPVFPPLAQAGGAVLIETKVDVNGHATESRVIQSSPPFDEPGLAALRGWTFRPARVNGTVTPTLAYVLFGFPQPVLGQPGGGH